MFAQDAEIIHIMGWREWLLIRLHWDAIRDWVLRILFCHHNARVLADMEYRLGCVLSITTRGMSKAYYDWPTMEAEIYAYQSEQYDEAYAEGVKDSAEAAESVTAAKRQGSADWQTAFYIGAIAAANEVRALTSPPQADVAAPS